MRALTAAILSLDGDDTAVAALAQAGLMQAQRFSPAAYRYRLEAFYAATLGHAPPRPALEAAPDPQALALSPAPKPKPKPKAKAA